MVKSSSNRSTPRHDKFQSPYKWIFIVLLAALAAFFGGASRYDAIQIVPLRAFSALLLIPALYYLTFAELKREAVLVSLLGLFVILTGIQLVPLPPELWSRLPGRNGIEQLDMALGNVDTWRPLSLAPMRTWNAFASLILPAAGLLLAIAIRASTRTLLQIIAGLGILNAALGLLQVITGRSSPLYFYELTNWGSPVGIFANENHSAIFAACSLLIVARLGLETQIARRPKWLSVLYPAAFFFIVFVVLVSGSRAGFVACLGSLLISAMMVGVSPRPASSKLDPGPLAKWSERRPYLTIVLPLMVLLLTVFAFLALGRAPAFSDILAQDTFADLRWSILPVLSEMLSKYWMVGSGFGSFEQLYLIYEPSDLLMPHYVNQAHNDWLQFVIEGGLIAGILLLGLVAWVVNSVAIYFFRRAELASGFFWVGVFSIIAASSLVDYPLRTPIFQLVAVWLLLALSRDPRGA